MDFFSEIGLTPLTVNNMFDQNGIPNGQIVCEFSDSAKARRATTKDGTLFGRVPVKVSMWPSSKGVATSRSSSSIGGVPSSHGNPFNPRGSRPSLLGPRPASMQNNSNTRFANNHSQSQNPFTQALQQSMPSPSPASLLSTGLPHTRPRGPLGERSTRFNSSNGGDDRSKHSGSRGDDMAPFENPGTCRAFSAFRVLLGELMF